MNVQGIAVTLVAATVFFFSFSAVPINAEEEGETLIREVSSALTTIARDIRGAHYRIEVQNDNDTVILVLHQFLVDKPSGIPKVGRKGYPKEGLPVKYVFSQENKILYREHLEGKQPLCEHFINIDFEIEPYEITPAAGSSSYRVPAIRSTFVFEEKGEQVTLRRLIVPRFTAEWAKQSTWIINSQGACLRFPKFVVKH
tara:strand:+ start:131 stop:727 length:597 start_codon:yes stop_codon:yes gene_type:complete